MFYIKLAFKVKHPNINHFKLDFNQINFTKSCWKATHLNTHLLHAWIHFCERQKRFYTHKIDFDMFQCSRILPPKNRFLHVA
ncbi:hypothetical protein QL285_023254 [Trifolium repens]|nr:hypothetical protein QL285_023254 [Trifolium repens]